MIPALAGRFLTTGQPGESLFESLKEALYHLKLMKAVKSSCFSLLLWAISLVEFSSPVFTYVHFLPFCNI